MSKGQTVNLSKMGLLMAALAMTFFFVSNQISAQQTFQEFLLQQNKEYEEFEKKEAEAFAKYVEEVTKKWKEFKNSTKRDWYEYSKDLNTLSRVDFKEGEITIETLVEKDKEDIMAQAQKNVSEKVEGLFKTDSLTNDVILAGQVEFNSKPLVDSNNVRSFVEAKVISTMNIEKEPVIGEDGVERLKITATIKMVPDHLRIRAEKYLPTARKYCSQYNLEIALVMAVMQTESYFNPRAKSSAPAFGLMQLVPKSGAREAYMYAHKQDRIVKPNYLYNPENNIHLGCAYLAKMRDNEFKNIHDKDKVRYCIVASYNTGPGNLSKAITGNRVLKTAVEKINAMNKNQLFENLKHNLPYAETRDYIVKVETRRESYLEWE